MNRRTFLSTVASALAASRSRLIAREAGPRLRVGVIGCGWFGGVNLDSLAHHAPLHVVSLCDPNAKMRATLRGTVARLQDTAPAEHTDYREMLAARAHDVVIVATPDHWHALPAIAAMEAGADVFLEKPIGVDVVEGEALVAAARRHGRVVQVNLQRRSMPLYEVALERYIRSGRLGTIGLVECFSFLPMRHAGTLAEAPVPEHLDYEMWTGPAPLLPFRPAIESRGWRSFMEYGNGITGDMGVHFLDLVRWVLGLGWPESIHASGGIYVDKAATANIADTFTAVFRYPGLDVTWTHRTWGASPIPQGHWTDQWGARLIGKGGTLTLTSLKAVFEPAEGGPAEGTHLCSATGDLDHLDFSRYGAIFEETNRRHALDFLRARESRGRPICDIEEGHISSACCILANLSQELGRSLAYDPHTRSVRNDPEASARLARPYRAPWRHPTPEAL